MRGPRSPADHTSSNTGSGGLDIIIRVIHPTISAEPLDDGVSRERLRPRLALLIDRHECLGSLAPVIIRHGDDARLENIWVSDEHTLQRDRRDVLSTYDRQHRRGVVGRSYGSVPLMII